MDAADRAAVIADAFLDLSLRVQAEAARPAAGGTRECLGCWQPIPAARRLAMPGADHCVACQADRERPW